MSKPKEGIQKKFATSIIWSAAGLIVLNGVLQLAVYPLLNRRMGEDAFGNVLYILSLLAIIGPTVGVAANNIRLIEGRDKIVLNGDLLLCMLPPIVVLGGVLLALSRRYMTSVADWLMLTLLVIMTTLRYYSDVEYRITLNYCGFFLYNCAVTAGYLAGLALYPLTESWLLCFLLGEMAAWLVVLLRGHIYRPLAVSGNILEVNRKFVMLALSYLLYYAMLNLDRMLLQQLVDSSTVTIYYVASLLGKTAVLLLAPLNGVLIGFLTHGDTQFITRKRYILILLIFLVLGAVFYLAITLVMPVFAHLLYPNIAEPVLELASLANLSQIICFSSSLLLTIMLTFANTKWQLVIQGGYAVLFLILGIVGIRLYGVKGFIFASLLANTLRFLATVFIGIVLLNKIPTTR